MSFQPSYFKASRWTKGNHFFPARLVVGPSGVTRTKPSLFGSDEIFIPMVKIASVHLRSGPVFTNILMESTGGTDPLVCSGFFKHDALEIQALIEKAQADLQHPPQVNQADALAQNRMALGGDASADELDRVPCPHCAELIKPAAKVCRFCDRDLLTQA